MKRLLLKALCLLSFSAAMGQSGYKNPVIPGFHPDPSVCRVGDDYYLVNSSFEYFPGVPLFHSKDLVNWKQIGHCLTRESQLSFRDCHHSGGIYAPTIRYNDGTFYMITTNVSGKGNFMVTTKDPNGPWSEPIWLEQGGIDPSLYFEDGKCYMASIPGYGISLCEIDPVSGKQLTPTQKIWNGTGGRYPEGPHIYKKDGWYYLLIAEGGTEYGHKVTIARSRDIYGPYEGNPANPIITHINMNAQSNQIQGVGHADFVQAHDGSWWTVCLAFRPQSYLHHLLGRETFLVPMKWEDNAWPVINGDGSFELDMKCATLPLKPFERESSMTGFDSDRLGVEWSYLFNPDMRNYSLTDRKGYLRLQTSPIGLNQSGSPTFVGRRQQHIVCKATTALELQDATTGDEAGMSVYMNNSHHYDLMLKQADGNKQVLTLRYRIGNMNHTEREVIIPAGKCYLRVEAESDFYKFFYSTDNKDFIPVGKMDVRYLSSETAGGFTGAFFALYASSQGESKGYADFDWFDYSY